MSLPSGYRQVEYIQSSGAQYIDSGYVANANTKWEVWGSFTQYSNDYTQIMGITDDSSSNTVRCAFGVGRKDGSPCWYFGIGATNQDTRVSPNTSYHKFTVDIPDRKGYVDDTPYSASGTYTSRNANLCFFARRTGGSVIETYCYMKFYKCVISENGTEVREYIPVVRNSDNKPGLYETHTETFLSNAGSGDFTWEEIPNNHDMYIGVSGVAQKAEKLYVGVNGVAREVVRAYIGVNGVAQLCFGTEPSPPTPTPFAETLTQSNIVQIRKAEPDKLLSTSGGTSPSAPILHPMKNAFSEFASEYDYAEITQGTTTDSSTVYWNSALIIDLGEEKTINRIVFDGETFNGTASTEADNHITLYKLDSLPSNEETALTSSQLIYRYNDTATSTYKRNVRIDDSFTPTTGRYFVLYLPSTVNGASSGSSLKINKLQLYTGITPRTGASWVYYDNFTGYEGRTIYPRSSMDTKPAGNGAYPISRAKDNNFSTDGRVVNGTRYFSGSVRHISTAICIDLGSVKNVKRILFKGDTYNEEVANNFYGFEIHKVDSYDSSQTITLDDTSLVYQRAPSSADASSSVRTIEKDIPVDVSGQYFVLLIPQTLDRSSSGIPDTVIFELQFFTE